VREEIVTCTARLIANPVAHKLKAAAIDDLLARLRALQAPSLERGATGGG
jgi:ATP phosphoribosyltransferase